MKSCNFKNSTFLNSKFNPITTLIKSLALTLIVLVLASCNGGSTSSNNSANNAGNSNSLIDFSRTSQLITATPSSCFSISGPTYTSASSGTFSINNTCSTPQSLSSAQITFNNGTTTAWIPSYLAAWWGSSQIGIWPTIVSNTGSTLTFSISPQPTYSIPIGGSVPVLFSYTTSTTAQFNKASATVSIAGSVTPTPTPSPTPSVSPTPTPTVAPSGSCNGIPAWSSATSYPTAGTLVVSNNVEYRNNWYVNPGIEPDTNNGPYPGSGQPWTIITSCSGTPTPTPTPTVAPQGSINLSVNTVALSSVCTGATTCNIPITLSGQNGNFNQTVTTITNSNAGSLLNISVTGVNAGAYTLTVGSNSLPPRVTFSAPPITVVANSIIIESAVLTVTPITTGSINYSLVKPTGINLANNSLNINLLNANNSSVGSNASIFGVSSSFININAGSYALSSYGVADAIANVYYAPLNQTVSVTAGNTTGLGNISLTKVTSGIVATTLNISGLASNDTATITLTDSNNYTFNTFTVTNGSTTVNLPNGDNVVYNVGVSSKYSTVAPVTASISSGKVVNVSFSLTPPVTTVFSAYKDAGINLNWSGSAIGSWGAYEMGTTAGSMNKSSATSLASVLKTNSINTVTWAFATGDCSSETWVGAPVSSFIQANVNAAVANNIGYIVSTGGAGGPFTCGSTANMIAFAKRYMSSNLVGFDFDIEGNQITAAQLSSLISSISGLQQAYPNIRISFTLATLASTDGQHVAVVNSGPTGGVAVMTAIQSSGLSNYYINLMTMDYGSASTSICYLNSSGKCDMGNSAIQAAKNFIVQYPNIPLSHVEVTPLIGINDIPDEIFSLADAANVDAYVRANGLGGLHYWSFDRDVACSTSITTTCDGLAPASPATALQFAKALR